MLILCCGGTIDKVYFDSKSDFEVGHPQAPDVLQDSNVTLNYTVESLLRKDSLDLTDEDRLLIHDAVASATESKIVITHGTDTMVQTASVLQDLKDKTVVFTGAMMPARFRNTDALFNLGFAIGVAQVLPSGIYIGMHGRVFDPQNVQKNRAEGRFEELS